MARRRDEPVRLTRIYTRGGDAGETSLGDGSRVSKRDLRIEACGTVDELNSAIGWVLAGDPPEEWRNWLERIPRSFNPLDFTRGRAERSRRTSQEDSMATAVKPRKNDIVLREMEDGAWVIFQDGDERLRVGGGAGVHLVDRERAQETADDIAAYENVDLWLFENGTHTLLTSHRS